MIFDHRIWKEFGVEVGEGTEMRSVKSVMEHNHVADLGPVAQKLKIKRKSQKSNASQKNQT